MPETPATTPITRPRKDDRWRQTSPPFLTVRVTAVAADGSWVNLRGHSEVTGRFRFRLPREKWAGYTYIGRAFGAKA
jgi:hypothetical protein